MIRKTLCALILGALIAIIAIMAQPAHVQAAGPSLAGSWQFTLTPATPPIPAIPIPGLATFTTDGSVMETDGAEVANRTPGHGIWQALPTGTNLYVQFISILVNTNGSLRAQNTTTMSVGLDSTGTMMKGTYTSQIVDPTGHVLQMSAGSVSGNLIPHPKFP